MAVSLSVVSGQGYLNHNERKFSRKNIDKNRSYLNQQIYGNSLEKAYEKLFFNSIEEYNKNQKRLDRKKTVDGYLQELENGKHKRGAEKPFYETIIQIGDKDTCGIIEHPQEAERAKQAILKYLDTWKERNPNLHVFNATLHMDEATPHMHIDYIPVATGYKQGIKVRNSLSKALENQGLGKGKGQFDNASIKWHEQERQALSEIAQEFGFEIEVKGDKRNRLTVAEYKAVSDKLEKRLEKNAEVDLNELIVMGKVILSKDKFDKVEQIAEDVEKIKEVNKVIHEKLQDEQKQLKEKFENIGVISKQLKGRERILDEREKELQDRESKCEELEVSLTEKYREEVEALQFKFEHEVLNRAIELNRLIENQRNLKKKESELLEREKALKIKENEYELIKEYLPKAKELLESEKEQARIILTQKAKEEQDLAKDKEFLREDIFIVNKKENLEPQGDKFGLSYHGKQTVITIYENGVAVDLNSHCYHISDIAQYDKENGKLSINGLTWTLSEGSQKKSVNAFISEEKRLSYDKHQAWYKVAACSQNTEREPQGNSCGFSYNGHSAFRIYENGVVIDVNQKKYNLTDFAKVQIDKGSIFVVDANWKITDDIKPLMESAYKAEGNRIRDLAKKAQITIEKQFIEHGCKKVSEKGKSQSAAQNKALKEDKIEKKKKSTITFSRPKDNGRGGLSR